MPCHLERPNEMLREAPYPQRCPPNLAGSSAGLCAEWPRQRRTKRPPPLCKNVLPEAWPAPMAPASPDRHHRALRKSGPRRCLAGSAMGVACAPPPGCPLGGGPPTGTPPQTPSPKPCSALGRSQWEGPNERNATLTGSTCRNGPQGRALSPGSLGTQSPAAGGT